MLDQISIIYYEHSHAKRRPSISSDASTAKGNNVPRLVDQEHSELDSAFIPNTSIGEGSSK